MNNFLNNDKVHKVLKIIAITLCIFLIFVLSYIAHNHYSDLKQSIVSKDEKIKKLSSNISDYKNDIKDLEDRIINYESQIKFMDNNVVICVADGSGLYHNYNCSHYNKNLPFAIFDDKNAKSEGFKPCKYCSTLDSTSNEKSEIVYVTNTGSKYHRNGCSYLKSSNPITKKEAISQGYTACSRCNP